VSDRRAAAATRHHYGVQRRRPVSNGGEAASLVPLKRANMPISSSSAKRSNMLHLAGSPPGIYLVTAKLPERDGEFEYHIKHTSELLERIARESSFKRPADEAHPMNAMAAPLMC
jgi:hypothetical protein